MVIGDHMLTCHDQRGTEVSGYRQADGAAIATHVYMGI